MPRRAELFVREVARGPCIDEFSALSLPPRLGHGWQCPRHPDRFRPTYKRTAGVRHLRAAHDQATGRQVLPHPGTKTWREGREVLRALRARFAEHSVVVLDNGRIKAEVYHSLSGACDMRH